MNNQAATVMVQGWLITVVVVGVIVVAGAAVGVLFIRGVERRLNQEDLRKKQDRLR